MKENYFYEDIFPLFNIHHEKMFYNKEKKRGISMETLIYIFVCIGLIYLFLAILQFCCHW